MKLKKAKKSRTVVMYSDEALAGVVLDNVKTNWTEQVKLLTDDGRSLLNDMNCANSAAFFAKLWDSAHQNDKDAELYDAEKTLINEAARFYKKSVKYPNGKALHGCYIDAQNGTKEDMETFCKAIALFIKNAFGVQVGGKTARFIAKSIGKKIVSESKVYENKAIFADYSAGVVCRAVSSVVLTEFQKAGITFAEITEKELIHKASVVEFNIDTEDENFKEMEELCARARDALHKEYIDE